MKKVIIILITILFQQLVTAQTIDSLSTPNLKLDLTLFDMPSQINAAKTVNNGKFTFGSFFKGYANPSMSQSLSLSSSLYSSAQYGIDRLFKIDNGYKDTKFVNIVLHLATTSVFNYYFGYAPGGGGWLHEEYHRATMNRHHVNSFNDMNTFPVGVDAVSVNKLTDEDLIRFKQEAPYDFIRMHVAGIEGEYMMINKLQRDNFFYKQQITHEILYIFSTLNSVLYVDFSASPDANTDTDESNMKESDIKDRDFTGLDFTAWAYDIFKPNEAYEDRGVHPLGNGINRYRKPDDLTSEELKYLKKQVGLQWLNFVSPMMFGFRRIELNNDKAFNFAVRNILSSFGNNLSFNILLQTKKHNLVFNYHHAKNYKNSFPAVEAELFEHLVKFRNHTFLLTPRVITGVQPKDQSFFTKKSEFLGLASCRIDWVSSTINPWIEVSAKTDGWVAGDDYTDSNISFRAGISAKFIRKK